MKKRPLQTAADLRKITAQTPGFLGADLSDLINEAALLARKNSAEAADRFGAFS
jgi:cell division protease FtsH